MVIMRNRLLFNLTISDKSFLNLDGFAIFAEKYGGCSSVG